MSNPERAPTQSAAPDTADSPRSNLAPSRLLLVRHGQSTWNADHRIQGQLDPPLSARGVAQASDLAERLTGHRLAGFYCSDLTRTRQTAELISSAVGVDPVPEPGLREIMLGDWEGKTREDLMVESPELWRHGARDRRGATVPTAKGARRSAGRVPRPRDAWAGGDPTATCLASRTRA